MDEADRHLLNRINAGDHEGWDQCVARFQKRLIAFAVGHVDQQATAEDLVQETFVSFLTARTTFRGQCSLESFLFQILKRRIVDHYRRSDTERAVPACGFGNADANDASRDPLQNAVSSDMHASWYVRREETQTADHEVLTDAVRELTKWLQKKEKFRDLKVAEGLFYARRRNQELANVLQISENEISLTKHRLIKRLREFVHATDKSDVADAAFDGNEWQGLLTTVWEEQRPSCPKRTTIGKYTLGILPAAWYDFVRFHLDVLECSFCAANLRELQALGDEGGAAERRNSRKKKRAPMTRYPHFVSSPHSDKPTFCPSFPKGVVGGVTRPHQQVR